MFFGHKSTLSKHSKIFFLGIVAQKKFQIENIFLECLRKFPKKDGIVFGFESP